VPVDAVPVHVMSAQAASADAVPLYTAPRISPAARVHDRASAPGMFRRVLSKLRGG
jgi:hypothetical protein